MATTFSEQLKQVVVIGGGVIGLTTAIKIQEKGGHHVTIIAEVLPMDSKTIKYTSQWAGAHCVSRLLADDTRRQNMERETLDVLWQLSTPGASTEGCFLRVDQSHHYCSKLPDDDPLRMMPNFRRLSPEELIGKDAVDGVLFSTITIDTPVYLDYLFSRFLASGGIITRGSVQHISQIIEGGANIFTGFNVPSIPDAIIVCAGLGARALGGVEDNDMYPIRGQIVLIRAPWIKFARVGVDKEGMLSYIIPRRSGDVLIGGTQDENDWYPNPRPETTREILERGLALCPELAPPEIRAEREPNIGDIYSIIIEEGCGLRPGRKGGVRLEIEWAEAANKNKVPIIFNYGHAGYGFQSSWGSAAIAASLLEEATASILSVDEL